MRRVQLVRQLCWLIPFGICAGVFWPGLNSWFHQDDFAWLGLRLEIYSARDLLLALFEPRAQGTIRPWSERGFFLAMSTLFGLDAFPYRLVVFATQALNMALVAALGFRLTGMRLAGFLGALFWGVNAGLGVPLSWTSSYNQVMCAAFLLGATLLWSRYLETGSRRYYWAQMAVFVLGFGALEINIVFPALAAALALADNREKVWHTAPMFAISGSYYLLHSWVAVKPKSGPYAMHLDFSMAGTLRHYWEMAFASPGLKDLSVPGWWMEAGRVAPWVLSAALAVFAVARLMARDGKVLFPLAWFVVVIGPVLPLRDHISYYYLAVPTAGLSMLGGWAAAKALSNGWAPALAAVILSGFYVASSATVGRSVAEFNYARTEQARRVVLGVEVAQRLHPGKSILLHGVGTELYWSTINDYPFRLIAADVHLTPGSEVSIQQNADLGEVSKFVFPVGATLEGLAANQVVVYQVGGEKLRNITQAYRLVAEKELTRGLSRRVNVGHLAFSKQLGQGWKDIEGGFRWMWKKAVVMLGGPGHEGQKLHLDGYIPRLLVENGAIELTVRVEGEKVGAVKLSQPDAAFHEVLDLRREWVGKEEVRVELEVDRGYKEPGEERELGIVFGSLSIR